MDSNDHEAQIVALLTEVQLPLRHYVQSLMPGNSAAKDVAQQANVKIWEKRGDFELGTHFKAWAFSIARYEVLNYRKREARDAPLVFSDELEEVMTEELAQRDDEMEQRHAALKQCLEKLRPADKQLILHRYFERSPLKSFAAKVGRTVGSLKVTLHRLRNNLHGCIERSLTTKEVAP